MFWPPREIRQLEQKLDVLAASTGKAGPEVNDEVRAWLARLLVVRSCGYLEQTVVEVCRGYVDAKSGGLVRTYARSWLERSRNPSPDNLLEAMGRFHGDM